MKQLSPSLQEIENTFTRPSDDLLMKVANRDSTVAADLRESIEADKELAEIIDELRKPVEEEHINIDTSVSSEIPEYITDLIKRRVAVSTHQFSSVPTAGQILLIDSVIGPSGDLGLDLPQSLTVLIDHASTDEEGEEIPDVWYGWMVAPETDYATYWDFILTQEDEPFDPIAGMVQVWNPVQVYLKSTSRVIGQLRKQRLKALHSVAEEYLFQQNLDSAFANPGFIALRTTHDGAVVLTGTPLSGPDDPRWHYQEIYHAVATEAVLVPAQLALEVASLTSSPVSIDVWSILKEIISRGSEKVKNTMASLISVDLTPGYAAAALGDSRSENPELYLFGDLVEIRCALLEDDFIRLSMRLLKNSVSVQVQLYQEDILYTNIELSSQKAEHTFILEPDKKYALTVSGENGSIFYTTGTH